MRITRYSFIKAYKIQLYRNLPEELSCLLALPEVVVLLAAADERGGRRRPTFNSIQFNMRSLLILITSAVANAWSLMPLSAHCSCPQLRRSSSVDPRRPTWLHAQSQITKPSAPVREDTDAVEETERSPLLSQLEDLEGIWYSDDFYGPHGREWVEVSATLVGAGTRSLQAVKASGDDNVPAGFLTWRTRGLPDIGEGEVPAEIQVRSDVNDPHGFSWIRGSLAQLAVDRIEVTAMYTMFMAHTGTFHKHQVSEGGG